LLGDDEALAYYRNISVRRWVLEDSDEEVTNSMDLHRRRLARLRIMGFEGIASTIIIELRGNEGEAYIEAQWTISFE
jgi:hypothetical protein